MRLTTTLIMGLQVLLAAAQNPFTMTTIPTSITVGTSFSITWSPTSTGTISILLVQGPSTNLKVISTITSAHANDGSFIWTLPTTIVKGSNYALEIVSDSNVNIYNYSGQFAIDSSVTAAPSAAISTASGSASVPKTASTSAAAVVMSSSSSKAGSSSTSGTAGTSAASATSSGATPSVTAKNAAGALKVGGGLLAFVAAVMFAM